MGLGSAWETTSSSTKGDKRNLTWNDMGFWNHEVHPQRPSDTSPTPPKPNPSPAVSPTGEQAFKYMSLRGHSHLLYHIQMLHWHRFWTHPLPRILCLQLGGVKMPHSQRWYILLENWCTVFLFPLWNRRGNCLFSQYIQVYTIQSDGQVLWVWHIWRKDMEETVSLEHRSALPFVPQIWHVHRLIACASHPMFNKCSVIADRQSS